MFSCFYFLSFIYLIIADLSSGLGSISSLISLTSVLTPIGIDNIESLANKFVLFNCNSAVPINSSVYMPRYTKGIFITGGGTGSSADGVLFAIDSTENLYVGYRNGSSWNYAKKL